VGSPEVILLDTHAAIWMATNSESLGTQSRSIIEQALVEERLAVSAISFWEIALLIERGRLESRNPPSDLREEILGSGIVELPLKGDIAILAVGLANLPGDPADRFIAATAIVHDAILVTADARLLRWQHKLRRQDASR
jgi:PIN domain nuclease of toxin-antitoxin system